MAKPSSVQKYRHHRKPHIEIHTYEDPETGELKVRVVNWAQGKVSTLEQKEEGLE